jgi:DNA primase catalytic subunit
MPGYIRTNNHSEKPARIHDALSGDEFVSDIESNSPQEDQSLKKEIKAKLDSLDEKSTIEALVENIEGVSEVVNFLKVRKGIDTSDGHGINYGGHSL